MKKCPFCGEDIEENLTRCPFCDKTIGEVTAKKMKWYHRTSSLVVGFLVVGPLILFTSARFLGLFAKVYSDKLIT